MPSPLNWQMLIHENITLRQKYAQTYEKEKVLQRNDSQSKLGVESQSDLIFFDWETIVIHGKGFSFPFIQTSVWFMAVGLSSACK